MRRAGLDFTVFEKGKDVGGNWLENAYPGGRLDTPNFAYSYSFAQNPYWPLEFSERDAILAYCTTLASRLGIGKHVEPEMEVLGATYDDTRGNWTLAIRNARGEVTEEEFEAVISSVGQLKRPRYPDLPGLDLFTGDAWHTAQWNHGIDLTGKRVGVVGTGASAYQVTRAILPQVASLTVFQRNPPGCFLRPVTTIPYQSRISRCCATLNYATVIPRTYLPRRLPLTHPAPSACCATMASGRRP